MMQVSAMPTIFVCILLRQWIAELVIPKASRYDSDLRATSI